MKKLSLSLDSLNVESFAVDGPHRQPGTVRAHISIACPDSDVCNTTNCNTWDTACGGGTWSTCTCTEAHTCDYPTVDPQLTCRYDTCGVCNPSDKNCTTYCP
jgi:hypothetical protein